MLRASKLTPRRFFQEIIELINLKPVRSQAFGFRSKVEEDQIVEPGSIANYIRHNYASEDKYAEFKAFKPPAGPPIMITLDMLEEARKATGREKATSMDQFPDWLMHS